MGLENTVTFMEKRDDIPQVLSALDVFGFTSVSDAFGRVLIEAMASAKPVVAFKGGAVPEIVEDEKTGFLLDAKDFKGMAEKITYLLKHKEVRDDFGRSGKQRVERLFDIKDHTRRIENLYSELLGGKKES